MAFDKQLLDILACPLCKGKVELYDNGEQQELICLFDRLAFPIKENIPVMLESEARNLTLDEAEQVKRA
ncbi:UPF0434 protein [Saliniradius amylolyticus]|uniref:UPF0434 protein HMF8227_01160 n=1 Tax=Saliniradius amylolyticus TaxID=2183582 RepID=A0A2S2E1W7_9ALTE|nr:Trm112 family protein [Saliniradius amylolyticus]AWL11641.1 UPF0434 protein [Saliniradius amylolyticus]